MPDIYSPQNINQNKAQASVASTMSAGPYVADGIVRQSAEAVIQRNRTADEGLRQVAYASAEVTRQGTQASLDTVRHASKTATQATRRTSQVMIEGQREIAQEAARTFQEVSRKMARAAQDTSEDTRLLATLPRAAEGGLRDLQQSMTGFVEGVVQVNLHAAQELFRLVNPARVIELQQRFAREYLGVAMQGAATMVRAVRRTADETLDPLEAQIEQRQSAHQTYRTTVQ